MNLTFNAALNVYHISYMYIKWYQFNCESYRLFHQGPTWTKNLQ